MELEKAILLATFLMASINCVMGVITFLILIFKSIKKNREAK